MVFHWSLSDSKSPQVSRTRLSILAVPSNVVVWIVSTRPPTSNSSKPFNNPLVTVPNAPITTGTIVTFMLHIFIIIIINIIIIIIIIIYLFIYFFILNPCCQRNDKSFLQRFTKTEIFFLKEKEILVNKNNLSCLLFYLTCQELADRCKIQMK